MVTDRQYELLSVFHKVDQKILKAVWYLWVDESLDKLVFEFDEGLLFIEAEVDFDTITCRFVDINGFESIPGLVKPASKLWDDFIGKPFGWGWIAVNQQNYLDGVLLSFDGICPNILLNVMASSITVNPIRQTSEHVWIT
jgi:hypothetical protein